MTNPQPPQRDSRTKVADHGAKGTKRAFWFAIIYALAAALWIYASDALLALFITDPERLSLFSTLKGLLFVTVTSFVFFYFARSTNVASRPADQRLSEHSPPKASGIIPIATFISIAILFTVGAYLVSVRYEASARAAMATQMEAIALLKARQIEEWLAERRDDTRVLTEDPLFARHVERFLAKDALNDLDSQAIRERLTNQVQVYGYRGVFLIDRKGAVRLSAGHQERLAPDVAALVREAVASGTARLVDVHWHESGRGQNLEFGFIAPFSAGGPGKRPGFGAVYLDIDPTQKLFPLVQSWPVPSPSAETLLVRRDGDEVLFLNELRHRKGTALSLRFPLAAPRLPASLGLRGQTGLVEGEDYRGVPVLAYITKVKGTPWLLVAKIDRAEIFAPIRRQLQLVTVLALVFIMVAAVVVYLWWQRQQTALRAAWYQTELERRSLAVRLDDLFRHANDIILLVDEQGTIVDANERAEENYCYPHEKLVALSLRDLRAPELLADMEKQWQESSTSNGVRFETVHRRSDGSTFPVEVSSRSIQVGERIFRQSIIRDITDRKLAEEELLLSERNFRALSEQFNALLDALPDAIFLISQDRQIVWANKVAANLAGGDPVALLGTFCFQSLHKQDRPCEPCPAGRALSNCSQQQEVVRTLAGSYYELRAVPVPDGRGGACNVIEIARDITEHRHTEEQLLHAQKMEAIGTLAGGIAHDFNNLLTTITGFGTLLQMRMAENDPLRKNVDHILTAADRAAALTRGLLAYSRKEAFDLAPIDLNEIVSKVEQFLSRIIGEDIELTIFPADHPVIIFANGMEIEQVLMNLATNARDAMPGGGSLLISVQETEIGESFIAAHGYGFVGRFALISVADTGGGMDATTRERIFEPFFTTKELGRGTGLGLAIVYGIVKQHQGFINVYSEPGEGTNFRVYLPLSTSTPRGDQSMVQASPPGKGETILIVEDSRDIRNFLQELLTGSGYRVIEASDGIEGVEKFAGHRDEISLVLMDVIMPRKNGKETLDAIRAVKPDTRALFMSGYTADVINRKGIDTAGLELISKPFTPGALLTKIWMLLSRRGGNGE